MFAGNASSIFFGYDNSSLFMMSTNSGLDLDNRGLSRYSSPTVLLRCHL